MSQKLHIAILGGGIRGTTLAALLSASGHFGVSIVEKSHIGAGTSSTNHGRLHLGTWNYRNNTNAVIARNLLSYRLLKQLPNSTSSTSWSYYCIESPKDIDQFIGFCEEHQIPFQAIDAVRTSSGWIRAEKYAAIFQIPEFSFNPARLAARFTKFAMSTGNCSLLLGQAKEITSQRGKFWVQLNNNMILGADIVINMLGRWSNEIETDLHLPKLELQWNRWRLLALQGKQLPLPLLDRVITIECHDRKPLGALPHGSWTIFGCDTPAESLDSPEDLPIENTWRLFDPQHPIDRLLLDRHAQHFPVLQDLPLIDNALFSFSGVYPEIDAEHTKSVLNDRRTPYGLPRVLEDPDTPNYFLAFGGNATTAVLDSAEMVDRLLKLYVGIDTNASEVFQTLAQQFPQSSLGAGMIWEIWENSSHGNFISDQTAA